MSATRPTNSAAADTGHECEQTCLRADQLVQPRSAGKRKRRRLRLCELQNCRLRPGVIGIIGGEDAYLDAVARMRLALDSGRRYSVDEVAAEFGIKLSDHDQS